MNDFVVQTDTLMFMYGRKNTSEPCTLEEARDLARIIATEHAGEYTILRIIPKPKEKE